VGDLELLRRREITLLGILRGGGEPDVLAPSPQNRIRAGDVLILQGDPDAILDLREELGLRAVEGVRRGAVRLASSDTLLVESVVPAGSQLVGRTLVETAYREASQLNVLAVSQHGQVVPTRVGHLRLGIGDTLLVHGHARDVERARRQGELLVLSERQLSPSGPGGWLVGATLAAALIAAALGWPLAVCALAGALTLVLLRCVDPGEALEAIDWSVILLTGGLLALGRAFVDHGLGTTTASAILSLEFLGYSMTMGSPSTLIRPRNMNPQYSMPSACNPAMVGLMILCSTFCIKSSSANGTGETAPIPPVFGPVSPSPIRL
jgi:K+/H+ antiporter YhaU regulatory subunit KhtT